MGPTLTLKVCSRRGFPDLSMRLSCRSVSSPSLHLSDLCQIVSWCIGSRFTRGGSWPLFRGGGWWTGRCNGRLSCTSSRWLILIVWLRQLEVKLDMKWRTVGSDYYYVPKTKI